MKPGTWNRRKLLRTLAVSILQNILSRAAFSSSLWKRVASAAGTDGSYDLKGQSPPGLALSPRVTAPPPCPISSAA